MKYVVIVEEGKSSFGAHVPDLPGRVAVAETKAEVLKLIQEAIQFHIEDTKVPLVVLFPGTAGVSPARQRRRLLANTAGETPAVPGKSTPKRSKAFGPREEHDLSTRLLRWLDLFRWFWGLFDGFVLFAHFVDNSARGRRSSSGTIVKC